MLYQVTIFDLADQKTYINKQIAVSQNPNNDVIEI